MVLCFQHFLLQQSVQCMPKISLGIHKPDYFNVNSYLQIFYIKRYYCNLVGEGLGTYLPNLTNKVTYGD
jgi:hypothetical protein